MFVYLSILQAWERFYFARLPQSLSLTTIKTQQSARLLNFWTWQRQNEASLRDFLNFEADNIKMKQFCETCFKMEVECRADGLAPMRIAILSFHLSKVLCLPRKSEARSYKGPHLSQQNRLSNLKIWCSKMQPVYVSLALRLPMFLKLLQNPHVLLTFSRV